jgi:hypothetical protein
MLAGNSSPPPRRHDRRQRRQEDHDIQSVSTSASLHRDQPPDTDSEASHGTIQSDGQSTKRCRVWLGRIFVFVEELQGNLVPDFTARMKYLSYQVEFISETNQLYYNVFVDFTNPLSESSARAQLGVDRFVTGGHQFSPIPAGKTKLACKSRAISSHYRQHPQPFGQYGRFEPTSKGTRTDLTSAMEILQDRGLDALLHECPELMARYYRNFKDLSLHYQNKLSRRGIPEDAPDVFIWWGATGSGIAPNIHLHTSIHHTSPHFITLHHTSPHFTTLHHTSSHFTTLHHTSSHFITLHHTSPHFIKFVHRHLIFLSMIIYLSVFAFRTTSLFFFLSF